MARRMDDEWSGEVSWPGRDWPLDEARRSRTPVRQIRDVGLTLILLAVFCALCVVAYGLTHTGRWG